MIVVRFKNNIGQNCPILKILVYLRTTLRKYNPKKNQKNYDSSTRSKSW
jgi:hypothetical protein